MIFYKRIILGKFCFKFVFEIFKFALIILDVLILLNDDV